MRLSKVFSSIIIVTLFSVIILSAIPITTADTWTDITCPYTITTSGNYRIIEAWTDTGMGVDIQASNVVLDGQNYPLNSTSGLSQHGVINIASVSNVTILNVNVTGAYDAGGAAECLTVVMCSNLNVINSYFRGCNYYGAAIHWSNNTLFSGCDFSNNSYGFTPVNSGTIDCIGMTIQNCTFSNNQHHGFDDRGVTNLVIDNCTTTNNGIAGNQYAGYVLSQGLNNTIQNSFSLTDKTGVYIYNGAGEGSRNCTLRNCQILNSVSGGLVLGGINSTIEGNLINNTVNGVSGAVATASGNILRNNTISSVTYACSINSLNSTMTIENNTLSGSSIAFYLQLDAGTGCAFSITNNRISGFQYALYLTATNNVTFYNNLVNVTTPIWANSVCQNLSFNTTQQCGTRVYSNGGLIGGNFYANAAHNGFSETTADNNGDGFCDTAFTATVNVTYSISDYLPLSGNATGFNVAPTYDAGSLINPSTAQTVYYGANKTFTYSANTGYYLTELTVDSTPLSLETYPSSYTFSIVTANHTIDLASEIYTYTITPSADAHSSISPSSPVDVDYGGNQEFTYSAATGYHLATLTIDGSPASLVTYPSSYTFTSVTTTHTIAVTSAIDTFTITASADSGSNLSPGTTDVNYGGSQTFTYSAKTGYRLLQVQVDGSPLNLTTYPSSYSFTNVQSTHTISVTSETVTYTASLTITAPANTTYTESTVPIECSLVTNGTNPIITYNIKLSDGNWVYAENQTYTEATTATVTINGVTIAYFNVVTDQVSDYEDVSFLMDIPPPPTPTPPPPYIATANKAVTNCWIALGLISTTLLILAAVILLSAARGDGDKGKDMFVGIAILISTFIMLIVGIALINGFAGSMGI